SQRISGADAAPTSAPKPEARTATVRTEATYCGEAGESSRAAPQRPAKPTAQAPIAATFRVSRRITALLLNERARPLRRTVLLDTPAKHVPSTLDRCRAKR